MGLQWVPFSMSRRKSVVTAKAHRPIPRFRKETLSMKRPLTNRTLLFLVILSLALVGFAPGSDIKTDPEISAIVSNVNSNNILKTAITLQRFRTRQSCSGEPEKGHG